MGLLPHRYPFALVDRVIEHDLGKKAVAIKNVTLNEPQFQGHFPDRPLMPGVLIVEAMAQVGGLIVSQMPDLPKGLFVFAGIDSVRFRRPVVPGDQLLISCELISIKRKRFGKVKGEANPADLGTKHLKEDDLSKHLETLSCHYKEGRTNAVPALGR